VQPCSRLGLTPYSASRTTCPDFPFRLLPPVRHEARIIGNNPIAKKQGKMKMNLIYISLKDTAKLVRKKLTWVLIMSPLKIICLKENIK
jgi:hypothetical protein